MKKKSIILQPVVSEKSFAKSEQGVYSFRVSKAANKKEIKNEIEAHFKVTVEKVNTVNRKGKKVLNWKSRVRNNRKDFKIAVIKLKSGDTIDIFK